MLLIDSCSSQLLYFLESNWPLSGSLRQFLKTVEVKMPTAERCFCWFHYLSKVLKWPLVLLTPLICSVSRALHLGFYVFLPLSGELSVQAAFSHTKPEQHIVVLCCFFLVLPWILCCDSQWLPLFLSVNHPFPPTYLSCSHWVGGWSMSHHALDKLEGGQDDRYGWGIFISPCRRNMFIFCLEVAMWIRTLLVNNNKYIYLEFGGDSIHTVDKTQRLLDTIVQREETQTALALRCFFNR